MTASSSPSAVHRVADAVLMHVAGLSVHRGDRQLLREFHFDLRGGEGVHLIGANGAGKTSLLRVLAGLAPAGSGQVRFRDRCRLIYLGHSLGLKPELTVEENLQFLLKLTGLPARCDIDTALQAVGIGRYFDARVGSLSAGQKRRVGLARLLLESADIWLLDEPFAALDVNASAWLCRQIERFLAGGGAVLLTSHTPVATTTPLRELVLNGAASC